MTEDEHVAILRRGVSAWNERFYVNTDLSGADLSYADLSRAKLWGVNLSGANLTHAALSGADLTDADLSRADLSAAALVRTNLTKAVLANARVYGASVWGATLDDAQQSGLVITPVDEPDVVVDNLAVAQFIYLLLRNKNIRDPISMHVSGTRAVEPSGMWITTIVVAAPSGGPWEHRVWVAADPGCSARCPLTRL